MGKEVCGKFKVALYSIWSSAEKIAPKAISGKFAQKGSSCPLKIIFTTGEGRKKVFCGIIHKIRQDFSDISGGSRKAGDREIPVIL
jgi:hypothetical protein